jgi:hypothetical protein
MPHEDFLIAWVASEQLLFWAKEKKIRDMSRVNFIRSVEIPEI